VAFSSDTTIYPNVSDTRTGVPSTIYPYTMSSSDRPRAPYARGASVRSRGSSRAAYAEIVGEEITGAGGYLAWLDQLELASPSGINAITGGTVAENRLARRQAQAAYDQLAGVTAASDSQVSVSDDSSDLGAALDAIGDTTEGIVEKAKRNPGATVAIVGGAILLFLLARRR
jgi:hypothetical protein